MAIPITIADDSTMSRRAVRRALPPEWDVTVHEAQNGLEALQAYEEGKAEVLFLDLTMPELDGYGVLEYLHSTQAKCIVIVISADIQPIAQERVAKLGAFRFLKKPLVAEELKETLKEVGLI
ncbi:response regulator [Salinispirillum marinum]|uniref:Response regulator n=2 Tax=Saccharospirillaceae TaxID=255527 RepID=A0ABV8BI36_9GAMM